MTDVALSAVMLLLLRDVVDVIAVEDFDECVVSLVAVADNICCCGVCKCCEHFVFFLLPNSVFPTSRVHQSSFLNRERNISESRHWLA